MSRHSCYPSVRHPTHTLTLGETFYANVIPITTLDNLDSVPSTTSSITATMKFTILALASALTISATPLAKREVGGVRLPPHLRAIILTGQILMCTGANATGTCDYSVYTMGDCHQLKAPFHRNINTFAPDGEAFFCFPRIGDCGSLCTSPTGCTFGQVDFSYENKYNLSAIRWDNLMSSFDCQLKE